MQAASIAGSGRNRAVQAARVAHCWDGAWARTVLALLLVQLLVGCSSTASLVRSFNPDGHTLLLVVDVSNSMNSNDPQRYAAQGAQLAASLVQRGDNFGCITYSTRARVLAPMREVRGESDRLEVIDALERVRPWGETNFISAIRLAQSMLAVTGPGGARAGATILFLTDGRPSRQTEQEVAQELEESVRRGWRVFSLALGASAHDRITSRMAASTGGAYFNVTDARGLIEAFLNVLGDIEDYLVYRGAERQVHSLAGSELLAFVALEPRGRFERLFRDGQELALGDPQLCFHYPTRQDAKRAFEVVHVPQPDAGRWEVQAAVAPRSGYILQKPPFSLEFVSGYPKRTYKRGEPVELALRVRGDSEELLGQLRVRASVQARISGPEGEAATLPLRLVANSARELIYEGVCQLQGPPETYTAQAVVSVSFADRAQAEIGKSVSFVVEDELGYALVAEPSRVDLGTALRGSGELVGAVVLRAQGAAMLLENLSLEGGQVSPQAGELAAGGTLELSLRLPNDGAEAGRQRFALQGSVRSGSQALPFPEVEVSRQLFTVASGPLAFELAPGHEETRALLLRVDPFLAEPQLQAPRWSGPGAGIGTTILGESLRVSVPDDSVPGSYRGSLRVGLPGGLQASLPCQLEVVAPRPRLVLSSEALKLEATAGSSADALVQVELRYRSGCRVQLSCSDLLAAGGGRIGQRFDIALLPEQGWGGDALQPDAPQRLRVRVWTGSDLPVGSYSGSLQLHCQPDDGGEATTRELPVTLEVLP